MKKLFFVLIFLSFFSSAAQAQLNKCQNISFFPQIEIYSSYGTLQYDTSKNSTQITEIASNKGLYEQGAFASGLATVDISTDITINSIGSPQDEGHICVYPLKATLFIGFKNPTIYISNDAQPNTCRYNVILRHEQTHQLINKKMLDYFLPLFRRAFLQIIRKTPPVQVYQHSQVNSATEYLTQKYNQKLLPLIEFFRQELAAEQRFLDNKKNYQFENDICR